MLHPPMMDPSTLSEHESRAKPDFMRVEGYTFDSKEIDPWHTPSHFWQS